MRIRSMERTLTARSSAHDAWGDTTTVLSFRRASGDPLNELDALTMLPSLLFSQLLERPLLIIANPG